MIIPKDYYQSTNVCNLAKHLLGKIIISRIDNKFCSAIISETEAYQGPHDRASHSYNNRRTPRNNTMYLEGGRAYIYICYGMHHLFNVVTAPENIAHAILIRAVDPIEGVEYMLKRRSLIKMESRVTKGPGALSVALGINKTLDGIELWNNSSPLQIHDDGVIIDKIDIGVSPRIGVESSGEAAFYPWRYFIKSSRYVSAHKRFVKED